jgi:hypothetical protein
MTLQRYHKALNDKYKAAAKTEEKKEEKKQKLKQKKRNKFLNNQKTSILELEWRFLEQFFRYRLPSSSLFRVLKRIYSLKKYFYNLVFRFL